MAFDRKAKETIRDLGLVFGAIMTGSGLVAYLPDLDPIFMVLGGLVVAQLASRMK